MQTAAVMNKVRKQPLWEAWEGYLKTMVKKERERPKRTIEMIVHMRHAKSTGLRPMWSERRFQ